MVRIASSPLGPEQLVIATVSRPPAHLPAAPPPTLRLDSPTVLQSQRAPSRFRPRATMSATPPPPTTSSRKLVLLGESAVGKSSLVLQFVKGQFDDYRESTIGAAFLTQTVKAQQGFVKFEVGFPCWHVVHWAWMAGTGWKKCLDDGEA